MVAEQPELSKVRDKNSAGHEKWEPQLPFFIDVEATRSAADQRYPKEYSTAPKAFSRPPE